MKPAKKSGTAQAVGRSGPTDCSLHESCFELLCQVFDYMESGMIQPHPDAPGHSHNIKGVWDADGRPCQWCATWEKVRKMCTENTTGQAPATKTEDQT